MNQETINVRFYVAGKAYVEYVCDICGNNFKKNYDMYELIHPITKGFFIKKPIACPYAGKHFEWPKFLIREK